MVNSQADIIAAMNRKSFQIAGMVLVGCGLCAAQGAKVGMPDRLVIARHTFFDFGPPFDYYELIQVKSEGDALDVERVLVTPPGQACLQPAKVESEIGVLHKTMENLLAGRTPCAIPENELRRELKRCKNCLTFSGVNITMQLNCGGRERQLHMDILDRDMFDSSPHTPTNTSWTMALMAELDKALSPGVMEKPMFSLGGSARSGVPNTELVRRVRDGEFDGLFGKDHKVSLVVHEADTLPPPPPSVEIEKVEPFAPISPKLPIYPPIAKAARVEGLVTVTFDVSAEGKVENIVLVNGPKLVELGVKDAVVGWHFPQSAWGMSGHAAIRFNLNCKAGSS
jgi:TonB family protein